MSASSNSLSIGQTVFQRYRLKRLLGRGGMGVVWLAHDPELDQDIALKFLADHLIYDTAAVNDLKKETRRGMQLAHPNILRVYGFFVENETAAIAMEYVEGNPISTLRSARTNQAFDIKEIEGWTAQLCSALHYAHTQEEIVHRDLKPANLMVDARNHLKVADFGIASSLNDAHTRYTGATTTRGTLSYMSPQQLMGQRPCVSHDIYSLGATLYDLLTGRPPFYSGDISLQIREVEPDTLNDRREHLDLEEMDPIPDPWEDVIGDCLQKDASLRPHTAEEIAVRLGLISGSVSVPRLTVPPISSASSSGMNRSSPNSRAEPTVQISSGKPGSRNPQPPARSSKPASFFPKKPASNQWLNLGVLAIAAMAVLVAGGIAFFALYQMNRPPTVQEQNQVNTSPASEPITPETLPPVSDGPPEFARIVSETERTRRQERDAFEGPPTQFGGGPPMRNLPGNQTDQELGMRRPPGPNRFGEAPPRQGQPNPEPDPLPEFYDRPVEGSPFVVGESSIEMLWIPSGNWQVGAPDFDRDALAAEKPMTVISLTQGFWIGRTEVTQRQFRLITSQNPSVHQRGPAHPVESLTWQEAMEFCRILTDMERRLGRLPDGYVYSLPTEFQWEYAAAAGYRGKFGSISDPEAAGWISVSDIQATRPVGEKDPTLWNLADVIGNVSEYTLSYHAPQLPGGRTTDYVGPDAGERRVIKGSSYTLGEFESRVSWKNPIEEQERRETVGFRVALIPRNALHDY